jgi:DNA-binding response OmpR family regulator
LVCVLLVDDEPALLSVVGEILERMGGFTVHSATSAQDAYDLLNRERYDVIISDYHMPRKDGLAFLKEIRNKGCTIPFIIFTGKGEEGTAIEALNNGVDFYIQKNGSFQDLCPELINVINTTCKRRKTEQEVLKDAKRCKDVIDGQTELITRFTPDGRLVFVNNAFCQYYQTSRDQIIGTNFSPDIPPEDTIKFTGFKIPFTIRFYRTPGYHA